MSVHRRKSIRTQITLPADVYVRLRQIAAKRGRSRSAVIADAIRQLPEASDQLTRMLPFAGIIEGGGPEPLGRMVDEVVYGPSTDPAGSP